jgi:hypothetical protein
MTPANGLERVRSASVAMAAPLEIPIAVPVQIKLASARGSKVPVLLRCQHRVPNSGRTSIFEA